MSLILFVVGGLLGGLFFMSLMSLCRCVVSFFRYLSSMSLCRFVTFIGGGLSFRCVYLYLLFVSSFSNNTNDTQRRE